MGEIKEKSIIVKRRLRNNFTMIPNGIIDDTNISLKAKGLLCFLLRQPDDFTIHKTELHNFLKEGRDGVINAFNELVNANYVVQNKEILAGSKHFFYSYIVYDSPISEDDPLRLCRNGKPVTGKPSTEKPEPFYSTSTNTNTNTDIKENADEKLVKEARDWYANEWKKNKHHEKADDYASMLSYIFKDNPLGSPVIPIFKVKHQISFDNFLMLDRVADLRDIKDKIDVIINKPSYLKGKEFLHLTLLNWLRRDSKK